MLKILFICHGNICRSPMAEFIFRDMIKKQHLQNQITAASAATSTEEIGNPVHYGTRKILENLGISPDGKRAVQMTRTDYQTYDFLIGMDDWNIRNMMRILKKDPEHKVRKLLDFSGNGRDIADPWYTGNFDETYRDIMEGLEGLMSYIQTTCLAEVDAQR